LTGALAVPWLVVWLKLYHPPEVHPRISVEELAWIRKGRAKVAVQRFSILKLIRYRQTWAYVAGKVFADPAWFFYLFWLPKFLAQEHGITGTAVIPYLSTVYILCGVGSMLGGLGSSALIRRGWTVNRSRKTALGVSAALMPLVIFAGHSHDTWTAVSLIGLTLAAHQNWSTTMYTMSTDLFPSQAVASATGFAGALGSLSTILFAEITGRVLQHDPHAYLPLFIACGTMYSLSFGLIHLFSPRLVPAPVGAEVREENH
jgi:ACS family hexuronate transporter-like MFS transporter